MSYGSPDLLIDLIRYHFAWDIVNYICDNNPINVAIARTSANNTALHEICGVGSAPYQTVVKILQVRTNTCLAQNKYGDTPLHVSARNSQKSLGRTKLILECHPEALKIRNNAGHTPLDTALVSCASFPVIKLLVEKEPTLLLMRSDDNGGLTPLQLLWSSFQNNLVGALALKSYLSGREDRMRSVLEKFWRKAKFCTMMSYRLGLDEKDAHTNIITDDDNNDNDRHLLCHAILAQTSKLLHQPLKIALMENHELAMQKDLAGNTPLHIVTKTKDYKSIEVILNLCPSSARIKDGDGRLALHIALVGLKDEKDDGVNRNTCTSTRSSKIVTRVLKTNVDASGCPDPDPLNDTYGLFPFMIAATYHNLQLTYDMLLERPLAAT